MTGRAPFHQITEREIVPVSPGEKAEEGGQCPIPKLAVPPHSVHSPPEWQTHVEAEGYPTSQPQKAPLNPALAKGLSAQLEFADLLPSSSNSSRAIERPGPTWAGDSNGPAQLSGLFPKSLGDNHLKEAYQEPHEPQ